MHAALLDRLKVGSLLTVALYLGAFGLFYCVLTLFLAASSATAPNVATAIARPAISATLTTGCWLLAWGAFRLARKFR